MAITSALVLLAVYWFMTLFVVLPLNLTTQGEARSVVPGTPESAPADPRLRRKALLVTAIAVPLWLVTCAIILTGVLPVEWWDLYSRFGPGDSPVYPATQP